MSKSAIQSEARFEAAAICKVGKTISSAYRALMERDLFVTYFMHLTGQILFKYGK